MIIAIIQARTGSTRLPAKILKDVCGRKLLEHEILRVKRSNLIDKIIVATTDKAEDDVVASIAEKTGVDIFRGSENDVLDRYYQVASKFPDPIVVRLTGDCPVIDHEIIDLVIDYYLKNKEKYDYVSNVRPATYPDGMDVEVFSFSALAKSWQEAKLPSEREHVTGYIGKNPQIFSIGNFENKDDLSELRMTIDEEADWQLIKNIYSDLYPKNEDFSLNDILILLKNHPEYVKINQNIIRNEGYLKSLANDNI